jgi:hypothetical protein
MNFLGHLPAADVMVASHPEIAIQSMQRIAAIVGLLIALIVGAEARQISKVEPLPRDLETQLGLFGEYGDDILYPISFDEAGAKANMRVRRVSCQPSGT